MKKVYIYILAIMPMLIWGMAYVLTKIVYKYYGPFTTTFIRLFVSSLILMVWGLIAGKFQKIQKKHILLLFLLSLVDPLGYFGFESMGLTKVSALVGSIIISTVPLFSALIGHIFLKEKLSYLNIAGAFLSFVGIGLMILKPDFSFSASSKGLLYMFAAVGCAIAYSVIIKKLSEHYSPFTLITFQNTLGAIYFLPLFLFYEYENFISVVPGIELLGNLFVLSFFGSTIAFLIYIYITSRIGVARTNMFVNLIPVFTLIASYVILKEELTLKVILSILIVISGLYLSQLNFRKKLVTV